MAGRPSRPIFKIDGRFSFGAPGIASGDVYRVLPFRRSRGASVLTGLFFAVSFSGYWIPGQFIGAGPEGGLLALAFAAMAVCISLVVTAAVGVTGVLFLGATFGRETIHAKQGVLTIKTEIFDAGFIVDYDTSRIRHLRRVVPAEHSRLAWRGPHIAFDYDGEEVVFGSGLDMRRAGMIIDDLTHAFARTPAVRPDPASNAPVHPHRPPLSKTSPSVISLVTANAIPILGALFGEWEVGDILLLYWSESAIVGVSNLCKIVTVQQAGALLAALVFMGHYGAFMAAHLVFLYGFFIDASPGQSNLPLPEVVSAFIAVWPAVVALAVSHLISFMHNFIGRREHETIDVATLMSAPYNRIIVMQLTLILGGFLALAWSDTLLPLVLMIVIKTIVDLRSHLREHAASLWSS